MTKLGSFLHKAGNFVDLKQPVVVSTGKSMINTTLDSIQSILVKATRALDRENRSS